MAEVKTSSSMIVVGTVQPTRGGAKGQKQRNGKETEDL